MTKCELKELIKEDKKYYFGNAIKHVERLLTHNPLYHRGKYIIICRKVGFYHSNQNTIIGKILLAIYTRKKNILGERLNIELGPNEFGRRLRIYHNCIVVNAGAVLGDDCELYGNNCIGNKGTDYYALEAPVIGNNVSIGVESKIIGHVNIGNNIKISSMSLVNKDINDEYALYGGVPAKRLQAIEKKKVLKY